jgi:addiction module RelE/StbE family toxin
LKVEITEPARADIERAFSFIAEDSPRAALAVTNRVLEALQSLDRMPSRGRPGRVTGTRELVVSGTRYIAVYRVARRSVVVIRVLHAHQDWPPR